MSGSLAQALLSAQQNPPQTPLASMVPVAQALNTNQDPMTSQAPTLADAMTANAKAYGDWAEAQKQDGIQKGLIDPNTGWPTPAALVDAARQYGSALLGSTAAPGEMMPGITAYHGSPYSFDQFKSSAIGTGEGAQVYGHGLYFAQAEPVAQMYRDNLSLNNVPFYDRYADPSGQSLGDAMGDINPRVKAYVDQGHGLASTDQRPGAISTIDEYLQKNPASPLVPHFQAARDIISGAVQKPAGSMYQVNIAANPDHFLDWDKPLSEQHPVVQQAVANIAKNMSPDGLGPLGGAFHRILLKGGDADMNGQAAHTALGGLSSPADAASALQSAGIPGIKYLDNFSRGAGDGTHNYVVFNPDTIAILRKYGIAGLTAGGAALATQQPQQ